MTYETLIDWMRWIWVALFVPLVTWVEKKRREFNSLSKDVEILKTEVNIINTKIDRDRIEREARRVEDQRYREHTTERLDKIFEVVQDVRRDTAVNSAKLDERK